MNDADLLSQFNDLTVLTDDETTFAQLRALRAPSEREQAAPDAPLVIDIVLPFACSSEHESMRARLQAASARTLEVTITTRIVPHVVQAGISVLPQVKNVIAVASGKGGVGKSTTAVNVALALAHEGARVGILDADIYGPSLPSLMQLSGKPELNADGLMVPHQRFGVQVNSIGFMIDQNSPVAWRGAMVSQALQQLFFQTAWQDLDYLIVDMPPGTGDVVLTLSQKIPVSGAIIVTTPQDLALLDARKGLAMFEKTHIPVLGIVENMALHVCSACGHEEAIFGAGQMGGAQGMGADFAVPVLGQLPLAMDIRVHTDAGVPSVALAPNGVYAQHYRSIARRMGMALAQRPRDLTHKFAVRSADATGA